MSSPSAADATWAYADAYAYMDRLAQGFPPMIICVACNGGVQGKEVNPAIPETPEEIATSVGEAYDAGASMVHVHARDPERPTRAATDPATWWEVNRRIRERCPDIIINDTTGGGFDMTMEERLSALEGNPEMASLNLTPDMSRFVLPERKPPLPDPRPRTVIDECLPFTYDLIEDFARRMKERGVKPELETYHTGGAHVIRFLEEKGLIEKPYCVQTVMGYQTSSWPTVDNVVHLVRELPEGSLWFSCGIGRHQIPMTTLTILMGGHARVGLEDNVYYRRGEKAKSNAQLVARLVRTAEELEREVATPAEARAMLGLSETPSRYDGEGPPPA